MLTAEYWYVSDREEIGGPPAAFTVTASGSRRFRRQDRLWQPEVIQYPVRHGFMHSLSLQFLGHLQLL